MPWYTLCPRDCTCTSLDWDDLALCLPAKEEKIYIFMLSRLCVFSSKNVPLTIIGRIALFSLCQFPLTCLIFFVCLFICLSLLTSYGGKESSCCMLKWYYLVHILCWLYDSSLNFDGQSWELQQGFLWLTFWTFNRIEGRLAIVMVI